MASESKDQALKEKDAIINELKQKAKKRNREEFEAGNIEGQTIDGNERKKIKHNGE